MVVEISGGKESPLTSRLAGQNDANLQVTLGAIDEAGYCHFEVVLRRCTYDQYSHHTEWKRPTPLAFHVVISSFPHCWCRMQCELLSVRVLQSIS